MTTYNITGNDTLTIAGRVITDFSDGDVSAITFPNDIMKRKTGKNKNTIWAKDEQGNNADLVIRLMRGSSDDVFMQGLFNGMLANTPGFVLIAGQFIKVLGDGQGNINNDVYFLQGGAFTKGIEVTSNVEGTTDQGSAVYHIGFAQAARSQQ